MAGGALSGGAASLVPGAGPALRCARSARPDLAQLAVVRAPFRRRSQPRPDRLERGRFEPDTRAPARSHRGGEATDPHAPARAPRHALHAHRAGAGQPALRGQPARERRPARGRVPRGGARGGARGGVGGAATRSSSAAISTCARTRTPRSSSCCAIASGWRHQQTRRRSTTCSLADSTWSRPQRASLQRSARWRTRAAFACGSRTTRPSSRRLA